MTIFEKVFEKELILIKDPKLREILCYIGDSIPQYNLIGPSCSSAKYHPVRDRGLGGNVYHTKSVVFCILRMAQANPQYDDPFELDILLAAGLLHDLLKYPSGKVNTCFTHPKDMQEKILFYATRDFDTNKKLMRIANLVAKHMSRFSTSKYAPGIELQKPESLEEYMLVYADMIASSPDVSIDLDAEYPIGI